jgi:hypothetical protein
MDRGRAVKLLRRGRREAGNRYRKWLLDRHLPSVPPEAIAPLCKTEDVILLCSRLIPYFDGKIYVQELAFAHEMAARQRPFALCFDPSILFEKSVVWFLPSRLVSPHLWDYSRQIREFAAGLERQGNRLLCSSAEVLFWENKGTMHRKFDELGVPTPQTTILTAENRKSAVYDIEPVLIKEEHSAGSTGIFYFSSATEARDFVMKYPFRPRESMIMQAVVQNATRDLRLTMVGDRIIESATYWRTKTSEALSKPEWTTTATTHNSLVEHGNIPEPVVSFAATLLRKLGIRTAGIDLIWADDDVSGAPLVLELSPYYQPNPPKPSRYDHWSYKQYKERPYAEDGYLLRQHDVFRVIAGEILDQGLY